MPIAQAQFKALGQAVGEAHRIVALDDADLIHVPAIVHAAIGGDAESDLDGFASVGFQVHHRPGPYAAARGVVAR